MTGATTAAMSERTRSCSGRVLCSAVVHCRVVGASFVAMPGKSRRLGGHAPGGSSQAELDRFAWLLGAPGIQLGGEALVPERSPHRGHESLVQSHLDRRRRHTDGFEKTGGRT